MGVCSLVGRLVYIFVEDMWHITKEIFRIHHHILTWSCSLCQKRQDDKSVEESKYFKVNITNIFISLLENILHLFVSVDHQPLKHMH